MVILGVASGEVIDLLCEFLGVAIHHILQIRNIYPAEIFERRRHFNVPVQWIRHPELREYIHSAVTNLHPLIRQGHVEKFVVTFLDSKQTVVEKFVFKLNLNQAFGAAVPINDMEYALRGFLIKLSSSESLMSPLPPDCSFEIVVYSKMLPGDAKGQGQFWISADLQPWEQPARITPIKSMCSDPLSVQLFIEHPSTS
ncbi:unnamed protein product [Calypogeia fissa]